MTDDGYNGLDNMTKVTRLIYYVKVDSLNTTKAMILENSDFCKDFDKCVTFYKDFLKQYRSTQSETRGVSEFSSGERGRSGGEKVKDCYYTKYEYSNISHNHKGKLKKICRKCGSNS